MFHVRNAKELRQIANSIGDGVHQFGADDEVWRGDNGGYIIGDLTAEIEEDEITVYALAGTLGEYKSVEA